LKTLPLFWQGGSGDLAIMVLPGRPWIVFLAGAILSAQAQIMSVDLGHEFFKVALMRQGMPLEIVLNSHSKRKTTTAVSFFEASRVFGDDALAHISNFLFFT
jgi:hypothetical protein